jgi:hypothetical protein
MSLFYCLRKVTRRVGIRICCRFDCRGIGVIFPVGVTDFPVVDTGSGSHPPSYPVGTGAVKLTTNTCLVKVKISLFQAVEAHRVARG